jgi:DNA-binding transcriptional LysR family regulator
VENRRSELVVRRLASPEPHRTIALVWRPRSPLGPALRRLALTMREACRAAEARLDAAVGGKPGPARRGSGKERAAGARRPAP